MILPNPSSAVFDIEKLRDYCLDSEHPRGTHKARVFESALGMTQADAMHCGISFSPAFPKLNACGVWLISMARDTSLTS